MTFKPAAEPTDSTPLSREERRSLWLNHAVAARVAEDPERAVGIARANLVRLQARHRRGQAGRVLAQWAVLLEEPVDVLVQTMLSTSQQGRDLRQNSIWAGVLDESERSAVLAAFYEDDRWPSVDEIRAQAVRDVLATPLLTPDAVEAVLGEPADRLRHQGHLLGLTLPGSRAVVHPAFQVDHARARIHPVVADVNRALSADRDPWGVASWWISGNDRLDGGRAPIVLVGTDVEDDLRVMVGLLEPARASDAISRD